MWPVLALALATGAAPVFTNKSPATPPAVRRSSDAALKPGAEDLMFIYGGFNGATLADFGAYRTGVNGWNAPVMSALPARERHAMAYDPVNDLVVMVGGASGFTVFDTVTLINGAFSVSTPPLPTPRPSARIDAALHWMPGLNMFLYFGGQSSVFGTNHFNDLWTLEVGDGGVTWTPVVVTAPPLGRGAVCSAWDPQGEKLVFFGGEINGPSNSSDVWTFAFDAGWVSQLTTGVGPSARSFCASEWEPTLRQLVVYGGQTSGPAGGLFSFDPATRAWTSYSPAINPGNLSDSAAAYSPQQKGILFFGGRSGASTYTNNTWLLRFNDAPQVDAGPDFSVAESATATLSGSVVDPEGDPFSSTWTQTQGPSVMLSAPALLAPTFTSPQVNVNTTLRFALSATDGFGDAGDEVVVTVLNTINEAPVALAGPDLTVDGGTIVTLAGSGSDPNGDMVTFGWAQLAGPAVTLGAPMSATTSFVAPNVPIATVLSFRLIVNDGLLPSAPDDVFVSVNPDPYVDAGTPDAGTPDAGSPDAGSPDAGSPDAGPPDAGTPDAGEPDSGEPDAGTPDAGQPDSGIVADAGAPDAGASDGGIGDPRALSVACGCSQSPASLWWLAGLVMLAWRRRR